MRDGPDFRFRPIFRLGFVMLTMQAFAACRAEGFVECV